MKNQTIFTVTAIVSIIVLFSLSLDGCKEDPLPKTNPTSATGEITNITSTTATANGEVTDDGNSTIIQRGFVISQTVDPTINDTKILSGIGKGTFSSSITGLNTAATYHIRAFATNSIGTSYGLDKSFITSSVLATVSSINLSEIKLNRAISGGSVTSDGGSSVTSRGVCWNTSTNPTISNSKTSDGNGTGNFVSSIASLSANTKYYVRGYATNGIGTAYGNEVSFTTNAIAVPFNGLVGWWPFNGNAHDESGNGIDGIIGGATLTTDRDGIANSAYLFNNSYIKIPYNSKFDFTEYSFSIWITTTNTGFQSPIKQNNYDNAEHERFGILLNYPAIYDVSSFAKYNTCELANGWQFNTKTVDILDGVYHHLVSTVSGGTISLYVDGLLVNTNETGFNQNSLCFGADIQIGRDWSTYPNPFIGKIDDVAIYSRALTKEEIFKIYTSDGF